MSTYRKSSRGAFVAKQVSLAIATLLAGQAAQAQFMLSTPWYGHADMTPFSTNNIEVGVGYADISGNGYRANEWGGMQNHGNINASFNYANRQESGTHFQIYGRNLGMDSRKLGVSGGEQGRWRLSGQFKQIMHRNTNEGAYFFDGLGSGNLVLRQGFPGLTANSGQPPANAAAIQTFATNHYGIKIDRQTGIFGGKFELNDYWGLSVNYRYDQRDGANLIGAAMGSTGGNPRSVIVPYPVNDNTHQLDLGLSYVDEKAQMNISYYYSKYSNDENTLTWQNPFRNTQWATGASFPDGFGRLDLAPDNEFHQIKLDAGYNLTRKSRLSGGFQYARSRQDQKFSPYTINSNLATLSLPVNSLNGKLDTTRVDLMFNTREIDKLNLKLKYFYDDRDNKTAQNWYYYVAGDSAEQPPFEVDPNASSSGFVRYNPVMSTTKHSILLDADYQVMRRNALRGWYQFTRTDMTPQEDVTRTRTSLNQYGLEWRSRSSEIVNWKVQYNREERRGSDDYDQSKPYAASYPGDGGLHNNPTLRQFHIADYDQNKVKASIDIYPTNALAFQLSADWSKRDFKGPNCGGYRDQIVPGQVLPRECLGLQASERQSFTLDMQYTHSENLNFYSFYTFALYKNEQDGRQQNGASNI